MKDEILRKLQVEKIEIKMRNNQSKRKYITLSHSTLNPHIQIKKSQRKHNYKINEIRNFAHLIKKNMNAIVRFGLIRKKNYFDRKI